MTPATTFTRPSGPLLRPVRAAADLVHDARERERGGCIPEAIECYEAAIVQAERAGEHTVLAEALRRLAVLRHHRDECEQARALCERSHRVALEIGHALLAAEALNSLGAMLVCEGRFEQARETFLRALELGSFDRMLSARVDQNLGVLANIQGELDEAMTRYGNSLEAYRALGDEHGCAVAYHNLGMVSADRELLQDAERYFGQSLEIAERVGDVHLQGLCRMNHAEVLVARQRFEDARHNAEEALALFDQLGTRGLKADAYRVIGVVYRETGRLVLAESRLRSAIELAVARGSVLSQAEASRELALVYQAMGRNQEALSLLNAAHRLFHRLDARKDLVNVDAKVAELENTYLAVVREWGQSIESSDTYTFGHCGRVAENALAVAQALGLDESEVTTIRLGAYLHDVGKVKVPHEILNKPGRLTDDEFEVIKMHPVWGMELLANVEFPWDLKPIIRWHHEKYDGSGYPDRLMGDEIPLSAQIVGIADVFDALTTTRSYRGAMSAQQAVSEITRCRNSWSPAVYEAFMKVVGEPALAAEQRQELAA
ncbi:MAG: tetratricopeptide repeat protein [Candidatus Omnitrophica bacterium]|nr:tetratricopeptide repeat protein [Candidatus Omnitrophota bacterium]